MKLHKQYKTLRLILGDQLNTQHSWFQSTDDNVLYVMFELKQELTYVTHHIQKVCAFFAAMREFAQSLQQAGHHTLYFSLDDTQSFKDLPAALDHCIHSYRIGRIEYQLPDEYRLDQQLQQYCHTLKIAHAVSDTEHFLTTRHELSSFFKGKKTFLMESFYRHLRRKWNFLMDNGKPVGDRWNFDAENRKSLPASHQKVKPLEFNNDVSLISQMLTRHKVTTIGTVDSKNFIWPVSRGESIQLLNYFVTHLLGNFGNYQDAMVENDIFIYHSRLSFSLNTKMLNPLEVVETAISHWQAHEDDISIAQLEGFIRQIIGWREYMRGIYWAKMPEYSQLNYFKYSRQLPGFYWSGNTRMNCMHHALKQSLEFAYAHHIQRLMITGNFALLGGINPDAVDNWYLGIYIDAIEWVELTNTRGMSQFADGGIVGSKPYVSSGNYINKMSNYCKACSYDVKRKTGTGSCPFNSLYWFFIHQHTNLLQTNPRMSMVYRTWQKMQKNQRDEILATATGYLEHIEDL